MGRYSPLYSSWTSGELSPRLRGRADLEKHYFQGAEELTNILVWPHGGIDKRPGTYYVSTATEPDTATRVIPFEYSTTQAYIIELGEYKMRFYMEGGIITTSGTTPYEIVSPYAAADLFDIRYVQSADVMYLVHGSYAPQKLTRTGHTAWTLTEVEFENGPFLDINTTAITVTPSAATGTTVLTASTGIFDAQHVGALWRFEGNVTKSASITAENQWTTALQADAGETIIIQLNGSWTATATLQRSFDEGATWLDYQSWTTNVSLNYVESQDGVFYRLGIKTGNFTSGTCEANIIKQDEWGYVKITDFTSDTTVTGTVERDLPDSVLSGTIDWSEGSWSDLNGWPETTTFYEQRLMLAGSFLRPQTIWASKVDDYEDFNAGTGLDDESYTYTIASQDVNAIRWMVDTDVLRIGTIGGEHKFGFRDSATTPTNVDTKRFGSVGSAKLSAVLIGNTVMFIQRGGKKVRGMIYDLQQESYLTPEISIRAEHMLREGGGVVDLAFAQLPDPIIWLVTNNGTLVSCTYDQMNGVTAFAEHETQGWFESVATIPGLERDEVWVVVRRNIDGTDTRYIEQFQTTQWESGTDAILMDSTITYANVSGTTTLSGLEHLENEEVVVITDGSTHPSQTVDGGTIDLNWSADTVHVGLGYTSTATTMPLIPPVEAGTSMGKRKKVFKTSINFYKTSYCKIGTPGGKMDIVPFRSSADEMNQRIPLFTGSIEQTFSAGFAKDLQITLVSDLPVPFSVIGLGPTMFTSPV